MHMQALLKVYTFPLQFLTCLEHDNLQENNSYQTHPYALPSSLLHQGNCPDASTEKLKSLGIHVFDLNEVDSLGIYVDGADEINGHMQMIKGGGAALTREKIIASVAEKFICIADASKQVDILGKFPLPVEVIPMARSAVARQLVKLGGRPEYRQGVVNDNGNVILDVHGMEILDPIAMENAINAIPGVVTVGLFANRGADVALIGTPDGVKTIVK